MTMDAAESARLGLNLNLSVQPQSYHWIQSPKGTDDEDEDDRRRVDDDGSPEDEPDILEMQREERETLNQLARRLASGSHGLMGGHTASMIQHLVYRHPNGLTPSDQIMMPISSRRPTDMDSPPGSSHSGDTPLGHEYPPENESSMLARKGEAQSWTFEEQFRQLYTAGNETDRRSFLDSLFSYMQEQGTPISRLPIMAKRVLDLYTLYKLVVQRGGIVSVITKKLWQEIIRGLGLPPSITSAAFTLRTQYVKYLYAYESKMNQFSSLEELNMAIAGNRREGRRNKSLLSEYLPSLPVSVAAAAAAAAGHHLMPSSTMQMSPGSSTTHHNHHQQQQQQQQQQQHQPHQQHYANVLAADDRFRHLAAAIIDNRHRAAEQLHARQQTPSSTSSRQASPQRSTGQLPMSSDPSLFNGHPQQPQPQSLPPSPYQSVSAIAAAHQAAATAAGDHSNKQREILSMLMWMDLMRANPTAIPRLQMPNLQPSSASPYAAAINIQPTVAMQKVSAPAPEQCEALNLGKKNAANNNNAGENGDEPSAKRVRTAERSPTAVTAAAAATRAQQVSPTREPADSPDRKSVADDDGGGGNNNENMIEMDIDVSAGGGSNGLKICVCKKTKHGNYKGQLVKVDSALNGGTKNASPFVLRLNGELYTGCLQLEKDVLNQNDSKIIS